MLCQGITHQKKLFQGVFLLHFPASHIADSLKVCWENDVTQEASDLSWWLSLSEIFEFSSICSYSSCNQFFFSCLHYVDLFLRLGDLRPTK